MQHILSKSTFVKGNQCHKALYLNRYHKELRDEIDAAQEAIFEQGTQVGELAQQLFPGGIDLSPENYQAFGESVKQTQKAIKKGAACLYEPAFLYDGVLAAMDILVKKSGGYVAYEVKSSTSVSDTYILDAALQYYLITKSGVKLKDICIVFINNQYVRENTLDVKQLFTIQSVLTEVLDLQKHIPAKIEELKLVLKQKSVPEIKIGPHCSSPYGCDFMGHCWKNIPDQSVFNIANLRTDKKWRLFEKGVIGFDDIDLKTASEFLNDKQRMQVESERHGKKYIDRKNIKAFLRDLKYPLHFLDFETFQLAVPVFKGSRPYQQIVFQYSMHKLGKAGGPISHYEFLAQPDGVDPRPAFIKQLIADCGDKGDILVYNIGFERGKLTALINDFPTYEKQLTKIITRLKDLMIPFQQRWYYVPEMQGSYSIKKVLPALVPELSYDDMEINNGGTVSNTYAAMVSGTFKGDMKKTRSHLLEYCKMDTWAMVKIWERLREIVI